MYVYLFGMYNNSRKNYSDNFFSMISPKLFKVIQISLLIYMREIFFTTLKPSVYRKESFYNEQAYSGNYTWNWGLAIKGEEWLYNETLPLPPPPEEWLYSETSPIESSLYGHSSGGSLTLQHRDKLHSYANFVIDNSTATMLSASQYFDFSKRWVRGILQIDQAKMVL